MATLTQLVQDLREEARRRWYYLAIIFICVGGMAAAGMALEVVK